MPVSASIYMTPPYIAVTQTASIYNLTVPNSALNALSILTFGYIAQTNASTTGYVEGDRILYERATDNPVIILSTSQFDLVSENDIKLKEDTTPPA